MESQIPVRADVNWSSFCYQVRAVDNGTPQRTGTAQVIVTVTDANNQMPQFLQNVYIASLMEGKSASG